MACKCFAPSITSPLRQSPLWAVNRRKRINLTMALQPSDAITDVHLKSMLDVVLESSQRQLTQLRATLKDNPPGAGKERT